MLRRLDNNSWTRVPNTKSWLRNSTRMACADRTRTQCPDKNIARAARTSLLYSWCSPALAIADKSIVTVPRSATNTCYPSLLRQALAQRHPPSRQRAPQARASCYALQRPSPRLRQGRAHSFGGQTRVNLCIVARKSQRSEPVPGRPPDSRLTRNQSCTSEVVTGTNT